MPESPKPQAAIQDFFHDSPPAYRLCVHTPAHTADTRARIDHWAVLFPTPAAIAADPIQ